MLVRSILLLSLSSYGESAVLLEDSTHFLFLFLSVDGLLEQLESFSIEAFGSETMPEDQVQVRTSHR